MTGSGSKTTSMQAKLASVQNILQKKLKEGEKLKEERVKEKQKEERVKELATRRKIPEIPCFLQIVDNLKEEMTLHDFVDPKRVDIDPNLPKVSLLTEQDLIGYNAQTYQEVKIELDLPESVKKELEKTKSKLKPKPPPVRKRKRRKLNTKQSENPAAKSNSEENTYNDFKTYECEYENSNSYEDDQIYPRDEYGYQEEGYGRQGGYFGASGYPIMNGKRTFSEMSGHEAQSEYDQFESFNENKTAGVEDIYSEFEKWYENSKASEKKSKAVTKFIPGKNFKRQMKIMVKNQSSIVSNERSQHLEENDKHRNKATQSGKQPKYRQFNQSVQKEHISSQPRLEGDAYSYLDSNHGSRSKIRNQPKLQAQNQNVLGVSSRDTQNPAELYRKQSRGQESIRPKNSNFVYTRFVDEKSNHLQNDNENMFVH